MELPQNPSLIEKPTLTQFCGFCRGSSFFRIDAKGCRVPDVKDRVRLE